MSPPLSIVIPTRLRDDALGRCLDRLAGQIATGDEVIVTDDGRSPATRAMVEARFPFARWTEGPQRGPAANRNHGASLARADLMVFLDDDVEPSPELLASYRARARERDDIGVYEGRTTCAAGIHSPLETAPVNETGGWLWSCNMMVRRRVWQAIGGFDEDFRYPHFEDVIFREQVARLGERVLFVPGATVDHPPRRVPPAHVLALHNEAYFIHHYKYLHRAPSMSAFFRGFFPHRVRAVLRHRLGPDSLVALGAICVESIHILARWRAWDRRWSLARGRAPDSAGSAP